MMRKRKRDVRCKVKGCVWENGGGDAETFYRDKRNKSGFQSYCKFHHDEYQRKSRSNGRITNKTSIEHSAVITATPATAEDLMDIYGIDKEKWEVTGQRLSASPLAKGTSKVSLGISLSKKAPIPQIHIDKIKVSPTLPTLRPRKLSNVKTALIIPDSQIDYIRRDNGSLVPFHDRRAFDVCLQIAQRVEPDTVIFLGDMLDLTNWNDKFFRSPDMGMTNIALRELAWWMGNFRSVCRGDFLYLEGNHEARMWKMVGTHLPAAWQLTRVGAKYPALSVPNLLCFDEIGVQYIGDYPNNGYWLNENLLVRHGSRYSSKSGMSVQKMLEDARHSEICGHIHRVEQACKTVKRFGGEVTYIASSCGTLADLKGPIPHASTDAKNWQNGVCVVPYEEGDGGFQINNYVIYSGETIFQGEKLVGRDLSRQIGDEIGVSL